MMSNNDMIEQLIDRAQEVRKQLEAEARDGAVGNATTPLAELLGDALMAFTDLPKTSEATLELEGRLVSSLSQVGWLALEHGGPGGELAERWHEFIDAAADCHPEAKSLALAKISEYVGSYAAATPHRIDESLILCLRYQNVGDVHLCISLLDGLQRKHQRSIYLCVPRNLQGRILIPEGSFWNVVYLDHDLIYYDLFSPGHRLQSIRPGKPCSIYKDYAPGKSLPGANMERNGLDHRKSLLGLDADTPVSPIALSPAATEQALLRFRALRLAPAKTVCIFPFSRAIDSRFGTNSTESRWSEFLRLFTAKAHDAGLSVFLNGFGAQAWVGTIDVMTAWEGDVKTDHLPLDQIIPFVNLAGQVLTIRSGICDLLRYSTARIEIFYPDKREFNRFRLDSLSNAFLGAGIRERVVDFESSDLASLADDTLANLIASAERGPRDMPAVGGKLVKKGGRRKGGRAEMYPPSPTRR